MSPLELELETSIWLRVRRGERPFRLPWGSCEGFCCGVPQFDSQSPHAL